MLLQHLIVITLKNPTIHLDGTIDFLTTYFIIMYQVSNKTVQPDVYIAAYAYDFALYSSNSNPYIAEREIERTTNLPDNLTQSVISINADKTNGHSPVAIRNSHDVHIFDFIIKLFLFRTT